jgi:hypothetical protein
VARRDGRKLPAVDSDALQAFRCITSSDNLMHGASVLRSPRAQFWTDQTAN